MADERPSAEQPASSELRATDHSPVGDKLPEAANRRLRASAWSSGQSIPDFASCDAAGLEPIGFVQGYAVMQWSRYGGGGLGSAYWQMQGPPAPSGRSQYNETWRCPHGFVGGEHRAYGFIYEQTWFETNWATGFGLALERMVDEAATLGAHGVIGVIDDSQNLAGTAAVEYRITGTAVVVPGVAPLPRPFTTFLSGQRLVKLFDAGFVPVCLVATLSAVQMVGYCITEYQLCGTSQSVWSGGLGGVHPIEQAGKAHSIARRLARRDARLALEGDTLHGASLHVSEYENGEANFSVQCNLRGTRVRRFKEVAPIPPPRPMVRLG